MKASYGQRCGASWFDKLTMKLPPQPGSQTVFATSTSVSEKVGALP